MPPKTRTFSGCWTCRKRKVKCDNTKPSCDRCLKSRLDCLGYFVKLKWSSPSTVGRDGSLIHGRGSTSSRRIIGFAFFEKPYKFHDEIDRDIEDVSGKMEGLCNVDVYFKGPFGVFRQRERENGDLFFEISHSSHSEYVDKSSIYISDVFLTDALVTSQAMQRNGKDLLHTVFQPFFELPSTTSLEYLSTVKKALDMSGHSLPLRVLNEGICFGETFAALWMQFLQSRHTPLSVEKSMWNSTIVPLLKKTMGELVFEVKTVPHPNSETSPIVIKRLVVLCTLAISSFHRFKRGQETLEVCLDIRQCVLEHFNKIQSHKSTLSTLLRILIVHVEVLLCVQENFQVLLSYEPLDEDEIGQIFRYMQLFYRSTSRIDFENYKVQGDEYRDLYEAYSPTPEPTPEPCSIQIVSEKREVEEPRSFTVSFNYLQDDEAEDVPLEKAIQKSKVSADFSEPNFSEPELLWGIPKSLFDLFEKTVTVANHRNFFLRKNLYPRNFPKICCDLEDELINWECEWDLKGGPLNMAVHHQSYAFYNALLVYYFRLIRDRDPNLLQNKVQWVIHHLESIVDIQEADFTMAPVFWTFFTAGCDAMKPDLQRRFFNLMSRFPSQWMAKQVMIHLWNLRRDGEMETSWLDMVKSWDISVFL